MKKIYVVLCCLVFESFIPISTYANSNAKERNTERKERKKDKKKDWGKNDTYTDMSMQNQTSIEQDSSSNESLYEELPMEQKNVEEEKIVRNEINTNSEKTAKIVKQREPVVSQFEEDTKDGKQLEEKNEHWGLKILAVIVTFIIVGKIKKKRKEHQQKKEEKERIEITKRLIDKRIKDAYTIDDLLECNKDMFKRGKGVRDYYTKQIEKRFNEIKQTIVPQPLFETIADGRTCYLKTEGELVSGNKNHKIKLYIFSPQKANQNETIEWLFENEQKFDKIAIKNLLDHSMENSYRVSFTRRDQKPKIVIEGDTMLILTLIILYIQELKL